MLRDGTASSNRRRDLGFQTGRVTEDLEHTVSIRRSHNRLADRRILKEHGDLAENLQGSLFAARAGFPTSKHQQDDDVNRMIGNPIVDPAGAASQHGHIVAFPFDSGMRQRHTMCDNGLGSSLPILDGGQDDFGVQP